MKILMLVNWKVLKCDSKPCDKQAPDYYVNNEDYWFFKYFNNKPQIDVIDISSINFVEKIEKNFFKFYIWQSIKALFKLNKYDLIVSHGMQSGVVISFFRRFFRSKAKHIVFDIGSFNSAATSGFALKLMQFSSKSIDGLIYHTSSQIDYYKAYFPWLVDKSFFVKFGTDLGYFKPTQKKCVSNYMICVGYNKRDWDTLIEAYRRLDDKSIKLKLIGHVDPKFSDIVGIEQYGYIPINELIEEISNARLCILPLESYNYSFGQMTLMQQMSLEKCVIAARVPSLIDYAEDGKSIIFYKPKDSSDLFNKIKEVYMDEKRICQIGNSARLYLLNNCSEELMANNIERVFNYVLNGGDNNE